MRWVLKALAHALVRKEDRRFITGKGALRWTDIKLVAMTHAHFIRSPARRMPKVKEHRLGPAAMDNAGRGRGCSREKQLVDDKVGNLICGWAITSRDGTPMKMGALAGDGAGKRCAFAGQAVAGGSIAETQEPGARRGGKAVVVDYEELPAAGRYSRGDQAGRTRNCIRKRRAKR